MPDASDGGEGFEGRRAPSDGGAGARVALEAPTHADGVTSDAFDSAAKTTVRGPARPSGARAGGGPAAPASPPVGHSVLLCASDRADDAPECIRGLGARVAWAELRAPRGGLVEVVRDALASLERLEEVLARLGSSAGHEGAYQVRLAEGLAHSLRDVLDEFGGEVDRVARGAWWVPLCDRARAGESG